MKKYVVHTLFAAACTFTIAVPSTAMAEDTSAQDGDYAYEFEDDPLTANTNGSMGYVMKVRPHGVRRTLIRPRLHFVPEMLESVEDL